jgi:hypothetical protein
MAFKLTRNALDQFEATVGSVVTIAVLPATTPLSAASYNGKDISPTNVGDPSTFTVLAGKKNLNLVVDPPLPAEAWNIVEVDGANTQILEAENAGDAGDTLIIVGK